MATFAKTFDVDISSGRPAASNEAYYHGETIEFRAVRGKSTVTNISYACIFYQTNGMDQTWWKTDGLVFHPTNDIGAASYRFFLEGRDDLGRDWHANGLLRLLDSPGFTPSAVELPVKTLDFASIAVTNAPFYTKAETDERIVALAPAPGNYAAVSNAAMKAVQTTDMDWLDAESKMEAIAASGDEFFPWRFLGSAFLADELVWPGDGYNYHLIYDESAMRWITWYAPPGSEDMIDEETGRFLTQEDIAYLSDIAAAAEAATNYTDEAIANIEIPEPADLTDYATHAQATNAARAVSAPLEENVGVLWQYVLGDTVWFAVTNYMRTVEGVVPSLQLWEVRDGATNLVYHSTEEITNFVNAATAALRADLTNSLADRAWSKYQSATGADNPQPGDITIVSTPSIMMTGGGEWNRYVHTGGSAVWVLKSNGLATFGGGTNGTFFAVQDDEGNSQFEIKRTDSYEVDAIASSCGWDQSGNFQVTYNHPASGNPPTLYASTNLATTAFAPEENGTIDSLGIDVSWAASGGLWQATITQDVTAPALFVHAKALQEGSIVVRNKAATDLQGGIFIGNTKYSIGTATISGHTVLTLTPAP